MKSSLLPLLLLLAVPAAFAEPDQKGLQPSVEPVEGSPGKVTIQFPNTAVSDVLDIYERLIGKPLVRDSQVYRGPSITLMPPAPVTREEACRLIESALLINGYLLLPGPEGSIKVVLNDPRNRQNPLREGIAIYTTPSELPEGDAIAAFFLPLDHLSPDDAKALFETHVQLNSYGRITPIQAPPALLITENVSLIRQIIKLKPLVDVNPSETRKAVITEMIEVQHADAVSLAGILQSMLDSRAAPKPRPNAPRRPGAPAAQSDQLLAINAQVVADARMNRLVVIAQPEDIGFIRGLVTELDQPVVLTPPMERPLKYVTAEDILPVLVSILTEGDDAVSGQSGARPRNAAAQVASRVRSRAGSTRGGTFTNAGRTDALPDQLTDPSEDNAPLTVTVGKTRLIADRQANAILVVGPPESYAKVSTMIDRLDRKPPQVYLATIIGQLTLDEKRHLGVDYLLRFSDHDVAGALMPATGGLLNSVSDLRNGISSAVAPGAGGLTVFGTVGKNLDILVRALESTNRFKILSRPTVYAANNKRAVITSGQQIPVPTNVLQSLDSNSSRFQTNIDYRDVVLKLEVVPLINSEGEVTLKIAQINDTVIGEQTVSNNTVPIIATERLNTTVTIPNGNTVVLGGLISEQLEKKDSGIPLLKDIPVLGSAFKSQQRNKVRRELVIFIQPVVVTDDDAAAIASRREDARTIVGLDAATVFPPPEAISITPPTVTAVREQQEVIRQERTTEMEEVIEEEIVRQERSLVEKKRQARTPSRKPSPKATHAAPAPEATPAPARPSRRETPRGGIGTMR